MVGRIAGQTYGKMISLGKLHEALHKLGTSAVALEAMIQLDNESCDVRKTLFERGSHWSGSRAERIHLATGVGLILHYLIQPIFIYMKCIHVHFIGHPKKNDQAARDAESEARNINK